MGLGDLPLIREWVNSKEKKQGKGKFQETRKKKISINSGNFSNIQGHMASWNNKKSLKRKWAERKRYKGKIKNGHRKDDKNCKEDKNAITEEKDAIKAAGSSFISHNIKSEVPKNIWEVLPNTDGKNNSEDWKGWEQMIWKFGNRDSIQEL